MQTLGVVGIEWTAGNVIGLAAVIVTGVGAMVTVAASAWIANRRMHHEDGLQKQRLAHERRESVRTTAAEAYVKTNAALRVLFAFDDLVNLEAPPEDIDHLRDGIKGLEVIVALGWDKDVQGAAHVLIDALGLAISLAVPAAEAVRSGDPDANDLERAFWDAYKAAHEANERYREMISAD